MLEARTRTPKKTRCCQRCYFEAKYERQKQRSGEIKAPIPAITYLTSVLDRFHKRKIRLV